MLCFVVVMQSFIMNSHEVFIPIHQGCFAGTGAIVRLPQCQWSKPDGYGKISQCITTTKHSKAKTVCIFLGIYCRLGIVFAVHSVMCSTCVMLGKINHVNWMCSNTYYVKHLLGHMMSAFKLWTRLYKISLQFMCWTYANKCGWW